MVWIHAFETHWVFFSFSSAAILRNLLPENQPHSFKFIREDKDTLEAENPDENTEASKTQGETFRSTGCVRI